MLYICSYLKTFGPIRVDVEPPNFNGRVYVDFVQLGAKSYLLASWNHSSFDQSDIDDGLIYQIYFAVGMLLSLSFQ